MTAVKRCSVLIADGNAAVMAAAGELSRGQTVVLLEDGDGDSPARGRLLLAATSATEERVADLLQHSSGLLHAALTEMRARWLLLDAMVASSSASEAAAQQLVSVDYRRGTTTGISAGDRAATLRALADPGIRPSDLTRPGHVIPVVGHPEGLLGRAGAAEAAIDLCALSGSVPVAVLAQLVSADRLTLLHDEQVVAFAAHQRLPCISVSALVERRRDLQRRIQRNGDAVIPREDGTLTVVAYLDITSGTEHLAVVRGDVATDQPVPVVVHRECVSADAVLSTSCACGGLLRAGLAMVGSSDRGVLVYLRGAEGQGTGAAHRKPGLGRVDSETATEILGDLGVRHPVDA